MKFVLTSRSVREVVEKVLNLADSPSINDVQRLYLSVVLGHLVHSNSYSFSLPSNSKTKRNIDHLLHCFVSCSELSLLPKSNLKILEEVAPRLVNGSSNPSWFTLAAHFYPYLGLKYVMKEKMTLEQCYDYKEYETLLSFLLSILAKEEEGDDETQKLRHELMLRVLKTAPNDKAVLALYQRSDLERYFGSKMDKDNLFIKYYQKSVRQSGSQGEKLVVLTKIPAQLRTMMLPTIIATLVEFLKSSEEPKKEHLKAFQKLIPYLQSPEGVKDVLTAMSKSKLPTLHGLFPKILNNVEFDASWRGVPVPDKVDICWAWITGTLRENFNNENGKTTAAYEAVRKLMSCSLNNNDEAVFVEVCNHVTKKILQKVDAISILRSSKCIESFPEIIQESYKNHVRRMLQEEPRLVRKAIAELDRSSQSSYSKSLDHSSGPFISR